MSRNVLGQMLGVLGVALAVAVGATAAPTERGFLSIDIHDGTPYSPIWGATSGMVLGNFMTWPDDTFDEGFIVQRIWFYHGGDYAESGIPYELHLVYRNHYSDGHDEFSQSRVDQYSTTCNYCWEELDVSYWFAIGGSDEEGTYGVFIRPLAGGGADGPQPRLWLDHYPDHEHLSALLDVDFLTRSIPADRRGDRDLYELILYYSDYGMGEVLLGMEIESDGIVAVEPTSFSAVKSLY
ncbi:hypothetical protein KDL67_16915 [bacterium]|nr:hypothetical protein [bacterium]